MDEEPDYSSLPLEERLVHKVWKVRRDAYQELDHAYEESPSEESECFRLWEDDPNLALKAVTDSNVVAQEAGISALESFLKYGGAAACTRTLSTVLPGLCEKGLSSSRAGTKNKCVAVLLWYVELSSAPPVIQNVLPTLSSRSPRPIAAAVHALNEIYTAFGCQVCPPKLAMDPLPKLFGHADRTVRQEALALSVTLHAFLGEGFDRVVFPNIKPIQQKDLMKAYGKISEPPHPTRTLRSQRSAQAAAGAASGNNSPALGGAFQAPQDGDVEMAEAGPAVAAAVDPYDLAEPVDVLAKVPYNFADMAQSSKWKERVAALQEVQELCDVMRIQPGDFGDVAHVLSRALGDVNLQVVTLAAKTVVQLATGLRAGFEPSVYLLLGPLLSRTKEKKKSVADVVNAALDACFKCSSFGEVCDPCVEYMSHKTPQIRIETCNFLVRCLKELTRVPAKVHTDAIMKTCTTHLDDGQVQVRSAMSEVIATMMKILGERAAKAYVAKIDQRHLKKIQDIYEKTEVKIVHNTQGPSPANSRSASNAGPARAAARRNLAARQPSGGASSGRRMAQGPPVPQVARMSQAVHSQSRRGSPVTGTRGVGRSSLSPVGSRFASKPGSDRTIPSKRLASPMKTAQSTSKMSLTARSLKPTTPGGLSYGSASSRQTPRSSGAMSPMSPGEHEELVELRNERQVWQKERQQLEAGLRQQAELNRQNSERIEQLIAMQNDFRDKYAALSVTSKSKDTQLRRIQSDLEAAKARISTLERGFDLKASRQASIVSSSPSTPRNAAEASADNSFETNATDLNKRISGLSIQNLDSSDKENLGNEQAANLANGLYGMGSNDESWKRATEVTNQLKARIEQMKARTRTLSQL